MRPQRLPVIILCCLCPVLVFAQSSAPTLTAAHTNPPPAPNAAELTELLNDFLAGASRNDIAVHERFWAEDVIYTSSGGKRRGKPEILDDVRKASTSAPQEEKTVYTAREVRVQQYGTTAIVAFRLVATMTKADKPETTDYLNTGTFLKRNGKWQVVAWQATKIPAEADERR